MYPDMKLDINTMLSTECGSYFHEYLFYHLDCLRHDGKLMQSQYDRILKLIDEAGCDEINDMKVSPAHICHLPGQGPCIIVTLRRAMKLLQLEWAFDPSGEKLQNFIDYLHEINMEQLLGMNVIYK